MAASSDSSETRGGCLCGGVRFVIRGHLREVTVCHCGMCRRSTTSVGAYTACAPDAIQVTAPALRWYRSSPSARRGFCGECGSQVFWEPSHGRHLSVALGSLDDPSGLPIAKHIYLSDDPSALRGLASAPD